MSFFTPNTDQFDSYSDKGKFLMAWRISLFFVFIFTVLALIFGASNSKVLTMFLSALGIGLICTFYLYFSKKYQPIFWIYVIFGSILSHFATNYVLEAIHFVDYIWIVAAILLAFIGLGKKAGVFILLLNIIGITFFLYFNLNNHINTVQEQSTLQITGIFLEIIFAFAVLGYLLYQYVLFQNHSTQKLIEQNEIILARDNEKTTLVKEIHHRVKNNLQIVISLLRLQKGELKSEEAKRHFSEAINRIMVMSLIHKKLYQEAEMANIDIKPYLTDLSNDVIHISNMGSPIKFNVNSQIERVGLKTIVPLGLLVNELLSNSVKHAFQKEKEGVININILAGDKVHFKLVYTDNGNWIEPSKGYSGFGLGLIQTLTEQLEGSFTRNESEYTFIIKNLDN